ncbi:glutathione Stransferase [Perkinsus chesapeaki]|uniref:Glutathione Stransferase n=1 Tax=Perkinsus chesapeaki TaxID=330153 RepID=A0A7J6M5Z7_PERCH|nr:glutathione Stransferase [Perkinsus chesapeaki]
MSDLVLYTFLPSNNCLRVEMTLREKGLPYERKEIDIFKGEHKTKEYLAINPRGTVPCLAHGPILIQDSVAAMQYLDMAFPNQASHRRSLGLTIIPQACLQYIYDFLQNLNTKNISFKVVFDKKSKSDLTDEAEALLKELSLWEGYLQGKEYLVEDFTLADIAVFPVVSQLRQWLGLDLEKYPNLGRWYRNMRGRPSIKDHPYFTCDEKIDEIFGTVAEKRLVFRD